MKKLSATSRKLTLLFIAIGFFSMKNKTNEAMDYKAIDNSFVKTSTNLYASKYEVTNVEYRLFLTDLKKKNKLDLLNTCMYDSSRWAKNLNGINEPMVNMYHWHPSYNNYPIVNIDYNAAVEYCKWLTEEYNNNPKKKHKKVVFRLPTENEWIYAARIFPDGKLPWYGDVAYDNKKNYKANVKYHAYNEKGKGVDYADDKAIYTNQVTAFPPNELGLYNIIGNVSEMLNIENKAKGGGFNSFIEECFVDKTQDYNGKDPQVGFRVFMEVIE